jgi:hypothetical protein
MPRLPRFRGSAVDSEPKSENEKARLRLLCRWALAFAVTVSCAATPSMVFGFGLSVFVVPVVIFIGVFPPLLFLNRHTVTRMHGEPPPPAVPWFRVAISTVFGLFFAAAFTLWMFQSTIDAVQFEQDPAAWDHDARQLQHDQARDTRILDQPIPVVDQDREVLRLQGLLDDAQTRLSKVKDDMICEEDGSCGTRIPGRGGAYDTKVARRDELAAEVTDLQLQLVNAKLRVADRAARLNQEKADATARQPGLDRRREELGTRPAGATRLDAVRAVAERHKARVGGMCVGSWLGFLALDLVWLYTIARRICRPVDGNGGSIAQRVSDREKKDTSGVKVFNELPARMREKYSTAGGDD